jgi:hypothetical protein
MKKLNSTLLESFRRFTINDFENFDTEKQLVESLTGEFKGNDKTEIGSAIHYIIETHDNIEVNENTIFEKFGVTLSRLDFDLILLHATNLGTFTPEIRLTKEFETRFGMVQVVGKTDQLQGLILRDTKVTFKPRDFDYYYSSLQWRLYLSIFGLDRFIYDVFEVQGYEGVMGKDISKCNLKLHEPMEMLRYDLMETEISNLINSFCDWVDYRCLWDKLPEAK